MTAADDLSSRQHKHTPDIKQHGHTLPARCARKAAVAADRDGGRGVAASHRREACDRTEDVANADAWEYAAELSRN